MDTSTVIALVLGITGFIISIIGLVIAPKLNLKSKRLEKRLECRTILFQKILELRESLNKSSNDISSLLLEVNTLIQLYGYRIEIDKFNALVEFYNFYTKTENKNERNRMELITKFNHFFLSSFNTYRRDLFLDEL